MAPSMIHLGKKYVNIIFLCHRSRVVSTLPSGAEGRGIESRLSQTFYNTATSMILEIDFYSKKKVTSEMYNSDDMAKEFLMQFTNQVSMLLILFLCGKNHRNEMNN